MCLDRLRLGKQRVECKQILTALHTGPLRGFKKTPWYNHPATRMWLGHERALALYGWVCCQEWKMRGYKDSLSEFFYNQIGHDTVTYPTWIGNAEFHRSHQSNLLRKSPEHYQKFGWDVAADIPYVWPANN
jgi:hypothetical protein